MRNSHQKLNISSLSNISTISNDSKSYVAINSKEFINFIIFQILWIGPWICGTIVLPLFASQWFGGCLLHEGLFSVEVIHDCEPDYVQYNFYFTLFGSIGGAVSFLLASFMGRLSDSFGRKLFLILGIIAWMIPRITLLFHINFFVYWTLAILPDINGGDQILPALKASVSDIISPKHRITAFGRIHGAMGTGLIIGAGFAIGLSTVYDNYTVIIATAIWYIILLLLTACCIREPIDMNNNRVPITSTAWRNPFRPLSVICQNEFICLMCIFGLCTSLVEAGVMSSLFGYIGHEMHLVEDGKAAMVFGIYVTTVSIVLVPVSVCFLPYLKRKKMHYSHMIAISVCFRICSLALLIFVGMDFNNVVAQCILYSAAALHGWGMFSFAVLEAIMSEYVTKDCQGVAFGVVTSYKAISSIIAPFSFGILFTELSETHLSSVFIVVGIFIYSIVILLSLFPLKRLLSRTEHQTVRIILKGDEYGMQKISATELTEEEDVELSRLSDYVVTSEPEQVMLRTNGTTSYKSLKEKLVDDDEIR